jgi:hypothetical protein
LNGFFDLIIFIVHSNEFADDHDQNPRTSYFNSPPLDISVAFPQATPASIFPPCSKNVHFLLLAITFIMHQSQ